MHGTLNFVICTLCRTRFTYEEKHKAEFKNGTPPECHKCLHASEMRKAANRRGLPVGVLRPDIILYNETHAAGDQIANHTTNDIRKRPDLLIVMGTSLKVTGIKRFVKEMSKEVRRNGKGPMQCVLINKTNLTVVREWKDIFDAAWIGDGDDIVQYIEQGVVHLQKQVVDKRKKRDLVKQAKGKHVLLFLYMMLFLE